MERGFKSITKTKREEKREEKESKRRGAVAYKGSSAKVQIYASLGLLGLNAAVKQTENKHEHRQTFTNAHCDFFCMTGGTYRKLQREQRADGAFEVGG